MTYPTYDEYLAAFDAADLAMRPYEIQVWANRRRCYRVVLHVGQTQVIIGTYTTRKKAEAVIRSREKPVAAKPLRPNAT